MFKVKSFILPFIIIFLFIPFKALSNSCDNYPYQEGIDYIFKKSKFKIISTAEIEFPLEEKEFLQDLLNDAKFEATLNISKFIKFMNALIDIDGSQSIFRFNGSTRNIITKTLRNAYLSNDIFLDNKVLSGISMISNCYEPGKIVRFTVQIGSDSIDSVEKLNSRF